MKGFFKSIPFHVKSAGKSLIRHFVMTLSASSAVMVTLLLFGAFLLLAGNINAFTNHIEDDIRIHAVLDAEIESEEQIAEVKDAISNITGVKEVVFSDKQDEIQLWIAEKGEIFASYAEEGNNPLTHAFYISVDDTHQIAQVNDTIKEVAGVRDATYGGTSVSQLVAMLDSIRKGIAIFAVLLGVLAVFLISNTIKMAIYARANEIAIMRNVGATNWFIKMPFMIEGMMIGLLGAIIPCICAYYGYSYLYQLVGGKLFTNVFALQPISPFIFDIMLILIASGMIVGLLGSFISTTRYLRWKR